MIDVVIVFDEPGFPDYSIACAKCGATIFWEIGKDGIEPHDYDGRHECKLITEQK